MINVKKRQQVTIIIGFILLYLETGHVLWGKHYYHKLHCKINLGGLVRGLALNNPNPIIYKNQYTVIQEPGVRDLIHQHEGRTNRIYSVTRERPYYPQWYRLFIHDYKQKIPYLNTEGKHYATTNAIYFISENEWKIIWKDKVVIADTGRVKSQEKIVDESMNLQGDDFEDYSKPDQGQEIISESDGGKKNRTLNIVSVALQIIGIIIISIFSIYTTARSKSIFKGALYAYTSLIIGAFMYYCWIPGALSYNGYKAISKFFFTDEPVIVGVIGLGWFFTFLIASVTRGLNILFDIRKQRNAVRKND